MQDIIQYRLKNTQIELTVLNIGASIKSIVFDGCERVLSYEDLEQYKTNPFFLGSVIGQNAGRISNGSFNLDGKTYQLEKNDRTNNLHGGSKGLHTKFWDLVYFVNDENEQRLKLSTSSRDLESGFPGNITYEAEYILDGSRIILNLHAKSDKRTFVNLTNHVYFNLNEDKSDTILNHKIKVRASHYFPLNQEGIPFEKVQCQGSIFDLSKEMELSQIAFETDLQTKDFMGYDHPFLMEESISTIRLDGIELEIKSDNPCLVLYTGCNISDGVKLNNGVDSKKYLGLCMEYQDPVNYMNTEEAAEMALVPGQEYNRFISWEFEKSN